jgi:hypothetical protein
MIRELEYLNNTINQLDLANMDRIPYQIATEYVALSCALIKYT